MTKVTLEIGRQIKAMIRSKREYISVLEGEQILARDTARKEELSCEIMNRTRVIWGLEEALEIVNNS